MLFSPYENCRVSYLYHPSNIQFSLFQYDVDSQWLYLFFVPSAADPYGM